MSFRYTPIHFATIEEMRADTDRFPHGLLGYVEADGSRWYYSGIGWVEQFGIERLDPRVFINITTPEEIPMPDKTPMPAAGETWRNKMRPGPKDDSCVISVGTDAHGKTWVTSTRESIRPSATVSSLDSFLDCYDPPKEAWEEPQSGVAWAVVRQNGSVWPVSGHGGDAERYARVNGLPAAVQCDVIPRLDTLKKVER